MRDENSNSWSKFSEIIPWEKRVSEHTPGVLGLSNLLFAVSCFERCTCERNMRHELNELLHVQPIPSTIILPIQSMTGGIVWASHLSSGRRAGTNLVWYDILNPPANSAVWISCESSLPFLSLSPIAKVDCMLSKNLCKEAYSCREFWASAQQFLCFFTWKSMLPLLFTSKIRTNFGIRLLRYVIEDILYLP